MKLLKKFWTYALFAFAVAALVNVDDFHGWVRSLLGGLATVALVEGVRRIAAEEAARD